MSEGGAPASGSSSEEQWRPSARQARLPRACQNSARCRQNSSEQHKQQQLQQQKAARAAQERDECHGGGSTCGTRVIMPLLPSSPPPAQQPRWALRSMWHLASVLNFLHVFRPLLNIMVEFSAEELETALITPNSTLDDIHIPLLKAIPPVTRMALGRATWITVLCRKLRNWWHWVADGEIPIVASHGAEIETYKTLDPVTRVLILKALCDIRVEQEDIRNYIEKSIKHGVPLSAFRRERVGGDSYGVSYWYEDDPVIGHRLYREIRQVEVKKVKGKAAVHSPPPVNYKWETVATNLDEFQEVSDKLLESKNRTEVALGKRLKIDILPEVEKDHKRKERLLKKQHRQALLLDSFMTTDGLSSGRALRDRKPVTYTFDDYDRSINEAIKITRKRQTSPDQLGRKEAVRPDASLNGRWNGTSHLPHQFSYDVESPRSGNEGTDGEQQAGHLDRSNRRRKRPQRYSESEFVDAISDKDVDFDSDDDVVGEVVYDEEYLRSRKQKKVSSSSEGDEEYHWEENADDEEEEDEVDLSISEDSREGNRYRTRNRSRLGRKVRSVGEIQSGLRRSKRSTRPRIDYRQYELSDTEPESEKPEMPVAYDGGSDAADEVERSTASKDVQHGQDPEERKDQKINQGYTEIEQKEPQPLAGKSSSLSPEGHDIPKRRFLDLNKLAPGIGFDDAPPSIMKDEDSNNF